MNVRALWKRLRSQVSDESTVDPDLHTQYVAQDLLRKANSMREQVALMQTKLQEVSGALIPETDKFLRRPIYERFLRRKHLMPLDAPTEEEIRDSILILRDEYLWADELLDEALRVLDEVGK